MQDFATRKQAVIDKVNEVIALGNKTLGVTLPKVDIRFDLKGKAAGVAGMRYGSLYVRFNVTHMMLGGKTWEHLLNDTVPHELAHSYCQSHPQYGRNHDAGWKRMCIALGGNGSRCYKQEDAPEAVARSKPYAYTTSTGFVVAVSPIIHSKIQTRGAVYVFRNKGRISKAQPFTMTNAAMLAAPTKHVVPTVRTVAQPTRTVAQHGSSNADRIRAYIAIAKADSGSEAFEKAVQYGIVALGMKAALARTYVKNNWNKV